MAISRRHRRPGLYRARALFLVYAARLLAPRGLVMLLVTLGGGLLYQWRHRVVSSKVPDLVASCYEIYTQLFFEHGETLPKDPILRVVFFVVPLIGAVVLAEGVLKLGASLFDFNLHREKWMVLMAKSQRNHVILVGLGHIGFRVFEELVDRGVPLVVIEKNESTFVEEAKALGVPVIIGDARRKSILDDACLSEARSVICCTDDDLVNLEVALDARKANQNIRLVMRMFEQSMAQKIRGALELDNTLSTSEIAAPVFAAAALDEHVLGAYRMGETMMLSMEVPVPKRFEGKKISAFASLLKHPIVGVHKKGEDASHLFTAESLLRSGDAVICHLPADAVNSLHERLAQS